MKKIVVLAMSALLVGKGGSAIVCSHNENCNHHSESVQCESVHHDCETYENTVEFHHNHHKCH